MSLRNEILEQCVECGLCRKECKFLKKRGTPKHIAERSGTAAGKAECQGWAFECSLCGLCAAVCPQGIAPSRLFLEMRREAVREGKGTFPRRHTTILNYERRGTSKRFSWYGLPKQCETVLFPGCTLAGTRPHTVKRLYESLKATIPSLGLVLDCCTKPSHDLGREPHFQAMFGELKAYLLDQGVRTVLVACPSCYRVFKDYGEALEVRTVYEVLSEGALHGMESISGTVTVHDACMVRCEGEVHAAARGLIARMGLNVEEMPHRGLTTFCCGEGGAARFISPDLSDHWPRLRAKEAAGRRIVAYCAGCTSSLSRVARVSHLLDILYEPEAAMADRARVSRSPVTYWNRLRLKAYFKRTIPAAATRERTSSREARGTGALYFKTLFHKLRSLFRKSG